MFNPLFLTRRRNTLAEKPAAVDSSFPIRHMVMNLLADLRFAFRSLARVKGLTFTVVVTLALRCSSILGGRWKN
jgi:hypothetical protein